VFVFSECLNLCKMRAFFFVQTFEENVENIRMCVKTGNVLKNVSLFREINEWFGKFGQLNQ